jgi:hypothetical protein
MRLWCPVLRHSKRWRTSCALDECGKCKHKGPSHEAPLGPHARNVAGHNWNDRATGCGAAWSTILHVCPGEAVLPQRAQDAVTQCPVCGSLLRKQVSASAASRAVQREEYLRDLKRRGVP